MLFNTQEKEQIVKNFQQGANDTGSTEVQVALLTAKIENLTQHLKVYNKDFSAKRGLIVMLSQRRRLLNYLKGRKQSRYQELISRLGLKR